MDALFSDLGDSLFEISPNMVIIVEDNAQVTSANPSALKELGFEADELRGLELGEVFCIPDNDCIQTSTEILSWLTSQHSTESFIEVRTNNGRVFRSRINVGKPTKNADGCIHYVICIHDRGDVEPVTAEYKNYKILLEAALRAIPDGFAVYDKDDRLQVFNKAYERIYDRTRPVLKIGTKFEDILRYGLEAGQYLEAGDTKESQEAWLKERLRLHKHPTEPSIQNLGDRWLRVEERKLDDGSTVGIRADITQFVEAKSRAEMLGNILDNMAAPVTFINLDTMKYEYANKAALNKLLYTLDEFVELGPMDTSTSITQDVREDFIQLAVKNPGTVFSIRTLHRRKDGTTYPCLINTVYESKDGNNRLISFIQDETIETKIRDELELQRAELQTIVHSLPCFITHSKPDTTLKFVNEEYAQFFHREPADLIGRKFIEFIPPAERELAILTINAMTEEAPVITGELDGVRKDGSPFTIHWTNRMVFKDGSPYELLSVGRDITETRNTEIKIERQAHELGLRNSALEQFAGIVSHDLKSPLRHISMFGEMFLEDFEQGKTENYSMYIKKMRQGSLRMEQLVSSLQEFSQVAYKQVNRSIFKLVDAIDEAKDNLASTIAEKNARIFVTHGEAELKLDYVLFVRVLENLIDNGIKYNDGTCNPEIYIEGKSTDAFATITVADNGIGIAPHQGDRIFNVFQRLHVNEAVYKGTGIGLALVKRIIEGHNGTIELDKNFVGGAKFDIVLPILT